MIERTPTVIAGADGSFVNFLEAAEEDFIAAVFVNANGTRIRIPASRSFPLMCVRMQCTIWNSAWTVTGL